MAWPLEHALVVQEFGPLRRWAIEIWPAAMFAMTRGDAVRGHPLGALVEEHLVAVSMV